MTVCARVVHASSSVTSGTSSRIRRSRHEVVAGLSKRRPRRLHRSAADRRARPGPARSRRRFAQSDLPDRVPHGRIEPERDGARRDRDRPPSCRDDLASAHPAGARRVRRPAAVSVERVSRQHPVRRLERAGRHAAAAARNCSPRWPARPPTAPVPAAAQVGGSSTSRRRTPRRCPCRAGRSTSTIPGICRGRPMPRRSPSPASRGRR